MKNIMIISLAALMSLPVFAGNQREIPSTGPRIEDYLGVWQAFREGDMPDRRKGEEPSKLVILRDSGSRVVVFLADRAADRQIHFVYGTASLDSDGLRFRDQNGLAYLISFGDNADYGRFLSVSWDFPQAEGDLGGYIRVEVK